MSLIRHHYNISGIVQGVGFRPFVYRLAHELELCGWTRNTPAGVEIEIQGRPEAVTAFDQALAGNAPPLAVISSITSTEIPANDERSFTILPSAGGEPDIQIAPDSALCCDCLRELFDPADRRYRYPFITCTNCGPRYSIITAIPYDRCTTTMAGFPLCPECRREYLDPLDRRFHAQPLACPVCGPQVRLIESSPSPTLPRWGRELSSSPQRGEGGRGDNAPIDAAINLLKSGKILAVKGIGGYHLAVDASNDAAVRRLRERKRRDEKPFAVMVANLATARKLVLLGEMEERLLSGPESPVVIVRKTRHCPVSQLVAPGNRWLGLMLPYTPLHHLLFKVQGSMCNVQSSRFKVQGLTTASETTNHEPRTEFQALVMTSANFSDEPIAFEDDDALQRLGGIADAFLTHNRPIHIRSDDSVLRVFHGKPLFYRRARGYTPRAIQLPFTCPPILALGAELKSAVCLVRGERAFLSQHIGDLQNDAVFSSFRNNISHLTTLLEITPAIVACDLHPDYLSSIHAAETGLPLIEVQHHHAHLAACMAENGLSGEVIGMIFDGTGYGSDGTIWGGEFLTGGYAGFQRAANFRPVRLPGGDAAVREPWRMALSYLYAALGEDAFAVDHPIVQRLTEGERDLFTAVLQRGINAPLTSSCGRLFDAVAALLHVREVVSYDGQAAIELEALAETVDIEEATKSSSAPLSQGGEYSYTIIANEEEPLQLDFSPMFPEILADLNSGVSTAVIAHRFHVTVARAAIDTCLHIAQSSGLRRVVLSGGVFQNRLLCEMVYTGLTRQGLEVFCHRLTPPNDGCIALGQAAIAGWKTRRND